MHENVIPAGCSQVLTFKKLKKLMETPPQVDRNRTPEKTPKAKSKTKKGPEL